MDHVSDFIGPSAASFTRTSGRVSCLPPGSGFPIRSEAGGTKGPGPKKREREKNNKTIFEEGRPTGSSATYIYMATLLDYPLDKNLEFLVDLRGCPE